MLSSTPDLYPPDASSTACPSHSCDSGKGLQTRLNVAWGQWPTAIESKWLLSFYLPSSSCTPIIPPCHWPHGKFITMNIISFNILSFCSWHPSIPPHFLLTCQISLADIISKDFNKEFFALNGIHYMDTDDRGFCSLQFWKTDHLRESRATPTTENWPGMLKHAFLYSLLLSPVLPWITVNTGVDSLSLPALGRLHCTLLLQVSVCHARSLSARRYGRYLKAFLVSLPQLIYRGVPGIW